MTWFWLGGTQHGVASDDSKELLKQLRLVLNRPDTDRDLTDTKAYLFLTQAQTSLFYTLSSHIPEVLKGVPEKMATADNGVTYFTSGESIGHMDIYASPTNREPLIEGPFWDDRADYSREGVKSIRFARARHFSDGPYARYVRKPGVIDDVSQPTLQPPDARRILPWLAAGLWAATGNIKDPSGYFTLVEHMVWGNPQSPGDVGLIPAYKLQHMADGGLSALGGGLWWRNADMRST